MNPAQLVELLNTPDLFVVSHSGARAGAPMVLVRFLDWLTANTTLDTDVVLLHGGPMEHDFGRFRARVLGGAESRLWMLQHGLASMGFGKAASALAFARLAPTMWAKRDAPMMLLNSVGSLPALQFIPEGPTGKVVLYVHELDESFERTIGDRVWERLSPKVDHFIACGEEVREMLVDRKGVPASQVSTQAGLIERQAVERLRSRYLRRELKIPERAVVIGASGRPDWRKAPEVFVRLARSIATKRPELDAHFIWLGAPLDDSAGWKIIHDYESAGLSGRFHLLEETDKPAEILNLYDVYALTSREDPYPLAMLEAASLGVPVVSFANGGAVEFAGLGVGEPNAMIVPYLDVEAMSAAVLELIDDPARREALGKRGQAHAIEQHLTDNAAPRLFEILASIAPELRPHWHGAKRRAVPEPAGPG